MPIQKMFIHTYIYNQAIATTMVRPYLDHLALQIHSYHINKSTLEKLPSLNHPIMYIMKVFHIPLNGQAIATAMAKQFQQQWPDRIQTIQSNLFVIQIRLANLVQLHLHTNDKDIRKWTIETTLHPSLADSESPRTDHNC